MNLAVLQSTTAINVLCAMQGPICDKMELQQSILGHNCLSGSERRQESWSGQPEGGVTNRAEPASRHVQCAGAQMGH